MINKHKYNLKVFFLSIFFLLLFTALFNLIINPYDAFNVPKIEKINNYKPLQNNNRFLAQFNRLIFNDFNDFIIGSSTATTLFQPSQIKLDKINQKFYNLGIPGQNFFSNYRTIEHLINMKKVDTIILNLDFFNFWIIKQLQKGYEDYRFSKNLKGNNRTFYFVKDLYSLLLSKDVTIHSYETLRENCCTIRKDNQKTNLYLTDGSRNMKWYSHLNNDKDYLKAFLKTARSYAYKDLTYKSGEDVMSESEQGAMKYLIKLIKLCHENNIELITVVNPLHDTAFYTLYKTGAYEKYINWLEDLHNIYSSYNDFHKTNFIVWDFTLHKYNSQKISVDNEIFFSDGHHALPNYGQFIIKSINDYHEYDDNSYVLNDKNIQNYSYRLYDKFEKEIQITSEHKKLLDQVVIDQNPSFGFTSGKSQRTIDMNKNMGENNNINLIWDIGDNLAKCQKEFSSFLDTRELFWISPVHNFSEIPESVLDLICAR